MYVVGTINLKKNYFRFERNHSSDSYTKQVCINLFITLFTSLLVNIYYLKTKKYSMKAN